MFPFFAPLQNQPQAHNNLPNPQFRPNTQNVIPSQNPGLQQPNQAGFNPQNANLAMPGRPPPMPMPWPCQMNGSNVQLPMQFGLPHLQQQQQRFPIFNQVVGASVVPQGFNAVNCNPQEQFHAQNAGQGVNQMVGLPHGKFHAQNAVQGVNQTVGLPQGQFHAQNATLPVNNAVVQQCLQSFLGANQLAAFNNLVANQFAATTQIGAAAAPPGLNGTSPSGDASNSRSVNPQQAGQPVANCWNAMLARPETPAAPQSSWPFAVPNIQQIIQAQNNLLSGGLQGIQESQAETSGDNNTHGNSTGPKFIANTNRSWNSRQSYGRVQNSRSYNTTNGKVNTGEFTGNIDKGGCKGNQRHPHHAKFNKDRQILKKDHQTMPKRSLSVTYTNQEILQWREARKRNYPTKSKIDKSSSRSDKDKGDIDPEAALRRQQLKEVLAKQAELGIEVAELPPNYLSETENKMFERNGHMNSRERRGRFQNNKFKRKGRQGQDNRHLKRQRHERPANGSTPVKRSPSLLRKLLSPEIRRDKSYLLQVFRFMTLNSFFDDWPEKPLVLPSVSARDACCAASEDLPSAGPDGAPVGVNSVAGGSGEDVKVEEGEACNGRNWESDSEEGEEGNCEPLEMLEEGEI